MKRWSKPILLLGVAALLAITVVGVLWRPVACTARGCVTGAQWGELQERNQRFAAAVQEEALSEVEALTTLVRQHLVRQAFIQSPATAADARRYREEILNLKDEGLLDESVGMTVDQYDELVILPFLQQEALRQQLNAESAEELYQQLSQDRWIVILPFDLKWDTATGTVAER